MRQEKFEYMTPQGRLNLQNRLREAESKLTELRSQRRSIAGPEGDGLHDNFAFEQLEIEERGLARTIAELKCKLANAKIIELPASSECVLRGSVVTIRFDEGDTETFTILGSADSAPEQGIISDKSPLGWALLGKRVGDCASYEANGRHIQVQIVNINIAVQLSDGNYNPPYSNR
jgi:transcription elongation factor GreA